MKFTIKGEHGLEFSATEHDESLSNYFCLRITEAYNKEIDEFIQEARVSFRKLKNGDKIKLKSRPITITLEKYLVEDEKS